MHLFEGICKNLYWAATGCTATLPSTCQPQGLLNATRVCLADRRVAHALERVCNNLLPNTGYAKTPMFGLWYRVRDGTLSRVDFQREMRPLHARIGRLLRAGIRRQHAKTRHTCANILKVEDALWTFVTTEGVAPTNNAAERALHRAVLWRRRPVAQSVASSVGHPPAPGVFSPSACPLSSHLMVAGARACARRRSGLGVLLVARRGHASPSNRLTSDMLVLSELRYDNTPSTCSQPRSGALN